jgi:hypothetical protein
MFKDLNVAAAFDDRVTRIALIRGLILTHAFLYRELAVLKDLELHVARQSEYRRGGIPISSVFPLLFACRKGENIPDAAYRNAYLCMDL